MAPKKRSTFEDLNEITLLIARLLHGYALSFTQKFFLGRFLGAAPTFGALLVAGLLCLWQGVA